MKNLMRVFSCRPLGFIPALFILTPIALLGEAFLTWDDLLGRTFEAKVVSVGAQSVKFENREGKQIDFPLGDLKPSSREQVSAWLKTQSEDSDPSGGELQVVHKESVFDRVLIGNLERLKGSRLKRCEDATRPEKYYVFYYTASWCPPCQRFTPELVKWYKSNKNENFELVLISSDRSEDAMEGYAKDKKMPWPQLKMAKVKDFKGQFNHGVKGIPSVIVCDLEGKNLGNFRGNLDGLSKMVK